MFVKHFLINYLNILGISNCTQPFYLVWLNSTLNPKPNIDHITYPGFIYVRKQKRFDCFLLLIMRKIVGEIDKSVSVSQKAARQREQPCSVPAARELRTWQECDAIFLLFFLHFNVFFLLFPKSIVKSLIFSKIYYFLP